MNITDIRIFPVGDAKLKAFASIILDHCFLVSGIKIIEGNGGLFLSMPSKRRKDGTFKDIAHPLNTETRTWMEQAILAKYRETLGEVPGAPAQQEAERAAEFPDDSAEPEVPPTEIQEQRESPSDRLSGLLGSLTNKLDL